MQDEAPAEPPPCPPAAPPPADPPAEPPPQPPVNPPAEPPKLDGQPAPGETKTVPTRSSKSEKTPAQCCCPKNLSISGATGSGTYESSWPYRYTGDPKDNEPEDYKKFKLVGHSFSVHLRFEFLEHSEWKPCKISWTESIRDSQGRKSTDDHRKTKPNSQTFEEWRLGMDGGEGGEIEGIRPRGLGIGNIDASDNPGIYQLGDDYTRLLVTEIKITPGCPSCKELYVWWAQLMSVIDHKVIVRWFTHSEEGSDPAGATPADASDPDEDYDEWRQEHQDKWKVQKASGKKSQA